MLQPLLTFFDLDPYCTCISKYQTNLKFIVGEWGKTSKTTLVHFKFPEITLERFL